MYYVCQHWSSIALQVKVQGPDNLLGYIQNLIFKKT